MIYQFVSTMQAKSAYCDYMEDVEGVIDSDTENYLAKEQQYFDDLETERNEIFSDKNLSETEKEINQVI